MAIRKTEWICWASLILVFALPFMLTVDGCRRSGDAELTAAQAKAKVFQLLEDIAVKSGGSELLEDNSARDLLAMGTHASPSLIEALQHEQVRVRELACVFLGQLHATEAGAALIDRLKDDQPLVRSAAYEALATMLEKPVVCQLIQALHNPSSLVQTSVAKLLRQVEVEALVDASDHEDDHIRRWVIRAFRERGLQNDEIIRTLIARFEDENKYIRKAAIDLLGEIGEPAVLPLINALKHDNSQVRGRAAIALGKIGPEAKMAIGPLIDSLQDDHVGSYSAYTLSSIGPASVPALIRVLDTGSDGARQQAVWALKRINNPEAQEALAHHNARTTSY